MKRPFSLWLYLFIVFTLSWPFQIIAAIYGTELLPRYILHASSMTMVTIGTYIAGRYVFKDGFSDAGWHWGKLRHYLSVVGLVLLLWAVPTVIELFFGTLKLPAVLTTTQIIWIFVFLLDFISCFGEEFGWRGYMLPHLARRFTPRKAVILHAIIWWAWHLPILVGVAVSAGIEGAEKMGLSVVAAVAVTVTSIIIISAIPAMLHGVVVAYFWTWSGSLAVVTVYHLAFDGVRDSIQTTIGLGPVSGIWSGLVFVIFGVILLWKGNWKALETSTMSPHV